MDISATYIIINPASNGAMLFPLHVDHSDALLLKHGLHLIWGSCCGKVNIVWLFFHQQIPHSTSSDPQLIIILLENCHQCFQIGIEERTELWCVELHGT